jgi:hypothetical protein
LFLLVFAILPLFLRLSRKYTLLPVFTFSFLLVFAIVLFMPITKELENIRKFEAVGFTHEQAETLADVIEKSHVDGQQLLKDSFHTLENRMNNVEKKIDNILRVTDNIDLHIKAGQADLLLKIFAIAAGCTSIAVAVSKLL